MIQSTIQESLPLIEKTMQPPRGEMSYYGGKHLETAWPGYTPERLREEMVDYAKSTLSRRLHAVGLRMAI